MPTSRVSVIMPVYNGARYVQEALESVLTQTGPEWELIVVDDGSTDASPELLRDLAQRDNRIRVIRQDNAGQSAARNAGAAIATSDYLAFLDQDDRYHPDHLCTLLGYLEAHPEAGLAYSDVDVIDETGRLIARQVISRSAFPFTGHVHPKESILDCLRDDMGILPGSAMVRKQAFAEAGGFDPALCGYEDDDLFVRIFWRWKLAFVNSPGLVYRLHRMSATRTLRYTRSGALYFQKLKELYPDVPELGIYYQRDLIVPRFCRSAIGASELARRLDNREALKLSYQVYRQISPKPFWFSLTTPLLHPLLPNSVFFVYDSFRRFVIGILAILAPRRT